MIETPRFAAHFHPHVIPNDGVVFASQAGYTKVKGRMFELVAPLIDGHRSVDAIAETLDGRLSAAEVFYAIAMLEQHGYVRENEERPAPMPE